MIDFNNSAYYFYNYTGERTWKVVGPKITQTMSGTTIKYNKFNKSTYYLFPQVSVTNTNYTKHIFAGEERICSKIGNGQTNTIPAPTPPTQAEITAKRNNQMNLMKRVFPNICISSTPSCTPANKANILQANLLQTGFNKITTPTTVYENNQYFYVTDHLGSSAWITNKTGKALQHMQYLPFGEIFVNQKVSGSTYDSEFKFLGKELDSETGYTKTDNRYYWANAGIFLSVDPLCDEYPMLTPYNYAGNNPLIFKDPSGLYIDWYQNVKTGEVVYHKELVGADDAVLLGDDYSWLGDDNMFGKAPYEVYNSYYSDSEVSSDVLSFSLAENSTGFMDDMGYKFAPVEAIEYAQNHIERSPSPGGRLSVDLSCNTLVMTEKSGYVPKDHVVTKKSQIGQSLTSYGLTGSESVKRVRLQYGQVNSSTYQSIGKAIRAIAGGSHDYHDFGPCTPNKNLINQFLKKYK